MVSYLQALKVNIEVLNNAITKDVTALVMQGVHHFKAEPAVLCSGGMYIDITIKQIHHPNGFDLLKDELVKAGIAFWPANELVTFVEWERI